MLIDKMEHKLIQDDDGHWYVIPIHLETSFNDWNSYYGKAAMHFDEYRVDGPHRIIFKEWNVV
jgi:hypothetical protein